MKSPIPRFHTKKYENHDNDFIIFTDPQTGMLPGLPESAICVQKFDDSRNSAIHITYRNSLRSSSMREPRDPLLKVVILLFIYINKIYYKKNYVYET